MRTKTLLLTAALSLAAIATSMAQVYSVNAVGYVNKTLAPGFSLIANQLIRSPDSTLNTLLPGVPTESYVYEYDTGTGLYTISVYDGSAWLDNDTGLPSTATLNPGEGFFFYNGGTADITVTFVGEVPQGNVGNSYPPARFSLTASKVPQALTLSPAVGFPNVLETYMLKYVGGAYVTLVNDSTQWLDNDTGLPATASVEVGEGFFLNPGGTTNLEWVRTFSVN